MTSDLSISQRRTRAAISGRPMSIKTPFWLILPALLFILALTLYPALYVVYLSFTNASLVSRELQFIGLENYSRLLTDRGFYSVLRNTFVFVFSSAFGQISLGFLLAYLTNKPRRGRVLVRTSVLLAWVIPEVIIALTFKWMFIGDKYGLINSVLYGMGVDIRPLYWLAGPRLAMFVAILMNVWRGTAFSMIVQLGGLQSIPNDLYEAAAIDGAGTLQNIRFITLPLLKQTIMVNIIFVTMWTFSVMSSIYVLTGGGPAGATDVIAISMYKEAFKFFRVGYASSIAMVMFVVNLVITLMYIKMLRRTGEVSY